MKAIREKINENLGNFMRKPIDPLVWVFCFVTIIFTRLFMDNFIAKVGDLRVGTVIDLNNLLFFSITGFLVWLWLSAILRENVFNLSRLMIWASLMFIFPPIFDIIKTGGSVFWSFYLINGLKNLWPQFITVFGNLPQGNVYFGSKIVFISAVFAIFFLVMIRKKSLVRAILGGLVAYAIFFFMASLPSWITLGYYFFEGSKNVLDVGLADIIQLLGIPYKIFGFEIDNLQYALPYNLNLIYFLLFLALLASIFFLGNRTKFYSILKNSRPPQIIYHTGLFFVGLGLGMLAYPQNNNINLFSIIALIDLTLSIYLAWLASVIINDVYDFEIDKISNPDRPLQKGIFKVDEYRSLGIVLIIFSMMGGLVVGVKFMVLLAIYQILAWAYSAPPYRLKRFPIIATALCSIAAIIIVFSGFIVFSGEQNIKGLSWRIILLLLLSLTLSLTVKDLKDIEGDKKYGVWTIPVILGEEKGRLAIAIGIFISFMLSVFLLNESRLFWWAILFGASAFWIVINKNPRELFWWVLGTVGVYGFFLAKIVFL